MAEGYLLNTFFKVLALLSDAKNSRSGWYVKKYEFSYEQDALYRTEEMLIVDDKHKFLFLRASAAVMCGVVVHICMQHSLSSTCALRNSSQPAKE